MQVLDPYGILRGHETSQFSHKAQKIFALFYINAQSFLVHLCEIDNISPNHNFEVEELLSFQHAHTSWIKLLLRFPRISE